jgi:hypothetical protein
MQCERRPRLLGWSVHMNLNFYMCAFVFGLMCAFVLRNVCACIRINVCVSIRVLYVCEGAMLRTNTETHSNTHTHTHTHTHTNMKINMNKHSCVRTHTYTDYVFTVCNTSAWYALVCVYVRVSSIVTAATKHTHTNTNGIVCTPQGSGLPRCILSVPASATRPSPAPGPHYYFQGQTVGRVGPTPD